jgi:hypothetical protein
LFLIVFSRPSKKTSLHRVVPVLAFRWLKELAVLLGGKVGVESEWGSGSTFWVRFPKQVFEGKPHPIEVAAPVVMVEEGWDEEIEVRLRHEKVKNYSHRG